MWFRMDKGATGWIGSPEYKGGEYMAPSELARVVNKYLKTKVVEQNMPT